MLRALIGFLGIMSLFATMAALAAPPVIDGRQAVAGARTSPGTGLCGTVTHFMSAQPVSSHADAVALMNKPTTDPAILGRTAQVFGNINFRNGQPNTNGDYTLPSYRDEVFPYSLDPMATPMGTDSNIVLRLRGYFNVPATLSGKTISFGVNCDDFCSLRIGTTDLMPAGNELVSARVIKQVTFKDSGLYPLEIVYYQNGSTAYLEWARTDNAVAECPNDICQIHLTDPPYNGQFKLLQKSELYSSVVGENPSCQECGAPGMDCSTGNYCGDGLCQACTLPDHCGPTCIKCPTSASICKAGQCVECIADDLCPNGEICETNAGKCMIAPSCTRNDQCSSPWICDPTSNHCQNPPRPCTTDAMCFAGQTCDMTRLICRTTNAPVFLPRQMVAGCAASGRDGRDQVAPTGLVLLFGLAGFIMFLRSGRHWSETNGALSKETTGT